MGNQVKSNFMNMKTLIKPVKTMLCNHLGFVILLSKTVFIMKTILLHFSILAIISLSSCQPEERHTDIKSEDFVQIASNFRSESEIVIVPGTEHYMGQFSHRVFLDNMFEAIYAGQITAYDFLDNVMSIEDVKYIQSHIDTVAMQDFETGLIDTVLIEEVLNPDDVVKIFTNEDWFFDKENFTVVKKVVSITFTTLKMDLKGDPIGYEILFKIYFNGREEDISS